MSGGEKRPIAQALSALVRLEKLIGVEQVTERWLPAGSLRRCRPEIGDIEIVAVPRMTMQQVTADMFGNAAPEPHNLLLDRLDHLWKTGLINKQRKSDGSLRWGDKYRALTFDGWTFEIFLADPDNYGLISLIRTGSAEFSQHVVTRIKQSCVYRVAGGYLRPWFDWEATAKEINAMPVILCPDEHKVFQVAGMHYVEPKDREI